MSDIDIYEQPLNERFRLFLRIEQLFERIHHHLAGDSPWDTHAALQSVLELLQTVSRGDSKRELIKEIDRERAALGRCDPSDVQERDRLERTVHDQQRLLDALHENTGTLGSELRGNDLLNSLQQRASAGGRPGILDLPAYQEWLQRPAQERHDTMREWLDSLDAARAGVDQCLRLVRESGDWQEVEVEDGFYEHMLERRTDLQLLRVRMSAAANGPLHRFPEISAGRQRFTIRFFEQGTPAERATQVHDRLNFEMACCGVT